MVQKLNPMLAAMLLAAMSGHAEAEFIEVKDGESVEEAIERARAEHRASCPICAAAHAAAQASGDTGAENSAAPGKEAAPVVEQATASATANASARKPIGYVLFAETADGGMKPVNGSFHQSREVVQKKLDVFESFPALVALRDVQRMLSMSAIKAEIRPVYGD